ncbi:MAG: 16S rRNA (guanine(527)-N(7))-methyltransferase RsmG [Syntrophomonadaceae bacterium]|nr:16S rRNA (guanine(527)-N(7))-methyltransferase RsmG [Syntrophomonadaceae bacterium]MDD3271727.1 16S rRNA (guanine(527)-N(7))-methyltransferase RsmG [Syntrophomonadaceae bacterium]MDD4562816.1 16S rRNA (guanine(527)-N(7))-methyltransferase RsmG [Syntrophomonadaceae bacterium]
MEYNVNRYIEMLTLENQRQNLISRKNVAYEIDKHIEDSLKITDLLDLTGEKLVDIGSGAGFPGMIIAIACPQAEITLVESDHKKSQFLMEVARELALTNVAVICARVEELGQDSGYRGSFSLCSSRAVASMNVLLEYGLPLLCPGGRLLLWKGRNYQQEIDQAQNALAILGGTLEEVNCYTLMEERDRALIVVRKEKPTPEKYPRRVGIPAKRPL